MLSGGHTPMPAYRELARRRPAAAQPFSVLFSDERHVPADSESSNYHQSLPLVEALALPEPAVLRVRTELPLEEAARDYERRLQTLLEAGTRIGLGLLGLGADGHTASLFGPDDLERARSRLAIPVQRPDGMAAVSVTPQLLARIETVLFVIAGGGKYDAIRALLAGDPALTAVQAVRDCPRVEVWVDQSAEWSVLA